MSKAFSHCRKMAKLRLPVVDWEGKVMGPVRPKGNLQPKDTYVFFKGPKLHFISRKWKEYFPTQF